MSPDLTVLIDLFYPSPDSLGQFTEVESDQVPQPFRKLLAHDAHMTVAMEQYHQSPVDVHVLATNINETHYSRKILLTRQSDGRIVQFGIVRLNVAFLGGKVRREIEAQDTPLGRILINNNVLRDVRPLSLWRIGPGPDLCKLFHCQDVCYGRTALIYCNSVPAVELLEIVTPE